MARISTTVDGVTYQDDVEPRMLLVHALRERFGLTGTPIGCDTSNCGACTVLLDGRSVKSCTVLAVQADGSEITTIQGLARAWAERTGAGAAGDGEVPAGSDERSWHPLQRAFHEAHALQCGYCTPGMIMAAVDLLEHDPDPGEDTIRHALEGNLCRCTGYQNIVAAVRAAAAEMA